MGTPKLPRGLNAAQLKHAAFLMGLPTAGTKPELESVILNRLSAPGLLPKPTRIVSVDMGIKNLGICALETTGLSGSAVRSNNARSKLKVLDWKKLDVLDHHLQQPRMPTTSESSDQDVPTKARRRHSASPSTTLSLAAFTPSSLSKTALALTKNILNTYKPSHVLIERQRFRSGGAAAVQEWTLRVNILESMIWACLETLRTSPSTGDDLGRNVSVHEVSPARVAKFWNVGPSRAVVPDTLFEEGWKDAENAVETEKGGGKISKGMKIAILQSWLWENREGRGTVELDFLDEAMIVANSFTSKTKRGRSGKLDDLTDCLLQGAAWVRWEENRQRILKLLR
jgi:cruciform cutting endonuclease 1